MTMPAADYDGAWKAALEHFLPDCLALLVPSLHAAIDWEHGLTFLDKELQKVAPVAALGPRSVDTLVQVRWRDTGQTVLLHLEAQHQRDDHVVLRMFTFYTRLLDRLNQPVISVAILGDDEPGWRPTGFATALGGCQIAFTFAVVKPLDRSAGRHLPARRGNCTPASHPARLPCGPCGPRGTPPHPRRACMTTNPKQTLHDLVDHLNDDAAASVLAFVRRLLAHQRRPSLSAPPPPRRPQALPTLHHGVAAGHLERFVAPELFAPDETAELFDATIRAWRSVPERTWHQPDHTSSR